MLLSISPINIAYPAATYFTLNISDFGSMENGLMSLLMIISPQDMDLLCLCTQIPTMSFGQLY